MEREFFHCQCGRIVEVQFEPEEWPDGVISTHVYALCECGKRYDDDDIAEMETFTNDTNPGPRD